MQKWFSSGPVVSLMKVIIPDLLKRQTPDIQPWFRETREAKFGVTLEEVRIAFKSCCIENSNKGVSGFDRTSLQQISAVCCYPVKKGTGTLQICPCLQCTTLAAERSMEGKSNALLTLFSWAECSSRQERKVCQSSRGFWSQSGRHLGSIHSWAGKPSRMQTSSSSACLW